MAEITQRPGKVAEILAVSGMTLRNYVKEFSEFLSPQAVKKTGRRFTDQDIRTLQIAASILRDGFTYDQAREQLAEQPLEGEVIDDFPPETQPEDIPPFEEIPNALQTLEFYEKFIQPALDAKDQTIDELKKDKERMQKELAWLRLPWYRRILAKPPE
jgi:DNA-binding transcriptional MerR regulator